MGHDSDDGADLDNELLELIAEDPTKKRKRSKTKQAASKRRKADVSDSEQEPESEEEDNPYPLEGKYIDEADRAHLMKMSELEREETLERRAEEVQKIMDRKAVQQLVRKQQNGTSENVSSAAKRLHTTRGATSEKIRKLDELRAKRKAKDEKKGAQASHRGEDSDSAMEMETEDEDDEDGQVSRSDDEGTREQRSHAKSSEDKDGPLTTEILRYGQITRVSLARHCFAPWFEEFVKGGWVRYLIGLEKGEPIYRICEISGLAAEPTKPYKIDDKVTSDMMLELKHGTSVKAFPMDKVSNSEFTDKEFDRLQKTCSQEGVKLPSKSSIIMKCRQMEKCRRQPLTEGDLSAMLAKKNHGKSAWSKLEKSRLMQARTLAIRRHDYDEVAEIDAKLQDLVTVDVPPSPEKTSPEKSKLIQARKLAQLRHDSDRVEEIDAQLRELLASEELTENSKKRDEMLAKVSERNRKANLEAMRRLELAEAERRRNERKNAALGRSGTSTPVDPSARLRTVPRMFNNAAVISRPGTPGPNAPALQTAAGMQTPSGTKAPTFESSMLNSVELDLGDF